jgi:hypothetical protein
MQKRTILLTQFDLSRNVTKWLFFIMGVSNLMNGISGLMRPQLSTGQIVLGSFVVATGILLMIPAFILFFPSSNLAPKCIIDEDVIKIKEDIHKKWKSIYWKNVKEITFKSFAIDFVLNDNSSENILLRTDGETSIEIKKSLRAIAETKSIPIIGG